MHIVVVAFDGFCQKNKATIGNITTGYYILLGESPATVCKDSLWGHSGRCGSHSTMYCSVCCRCLLLCLGDSFSTKDKYDWYCRAPHFLTVRRQIAGNLKWANWKNAPSEGRHTASAWRIAVTLLRLWGRGHRCVIPLITSHAGTRTIVDQSRASEQNQIQPPR